MLAQSHYYAGMIDSSVGCHLNYIIISYNISYIWPYWYDILQSIAMVWPPLWATGRRSVKKEVILQFSKNLVSEKGVRRHTINSLPSVCELKAYLCLIIICVLPQKEQKGAMHSVKGRWQWAVFPDAGRAGHWWTSWKMRGREGWRRQRWN